MTIGELLEELERFPKTHEVRFASGYNSETEVASVYLADHKMPLVWVDLLEKGA